MNRMSDGKPCLTEMRACSPCRCNRTPTPRRGSLILELFVAFTLLVAVLSVATPLVVRHGRLLASARHYRLALEELTNQAEQLSALGVAEVERQVKQLKPSDFTVAHLPGAEVSGQVVDASFGKRVTLSIVWDEPRRREAPLRLVTFVVERK